MHLQHASSAGKNPSPSKSAHHSYSHSYSYSYSHSHSASHHKSHATHAPVVVHGQIEKRNLIDFFKRVINSQANENSSATLSASFSSMASASPSANTPAAGSSTKKTVKDILAILQDDPHASIDFDDIVAPAPSSASLHASSSSHHARGKRNVSLSSLSSKASSKASASAYASASASAMPSLS
ncbi:unnamed protein product [Absidia cylindrospora]